MRTFLQQTAGATFFRGLSMTFAVRKDHVEYIMKISNGFYGVVNFLFYGKDQVMLLAGWGSFFKRVTNHTDKDKLFRMLDRSCPEVVKLFTGESGYEVVTFPAGDMGICKILPTDTSRTLIAILGDQTLVEEASLLINYCLKLYHEINDHCPFPGWKQGLMEDL